MLLSIEVMCGELSLDGFEKSKTCIFFLSFNLQQYLKKCFPPSLSFVARAVIIENEEDWYGRASTNGNYHGLTILCPTH